MRHKTQVPLHLEALEDRWIPATVKLVGGNLYISNPLVIGGLASITLTATGPNQFKVQDGPVSLGTYKVGGIFVTGSNAKDNITVNLGTFTFGGNLFISAGNSNDSATVTGAGSAGNAGAGTVAGNVTILSGLGNNNVTISAPQIGGSVQALSALGNDTFALGNSGAASAVGGDVTVTGFATVTLGAGQTDTIGGAVNIQNAQTTKGNTIALNDKLSIGKDLTYNGGSGADTVNLFGFKVLGNAAFNLGEGANQIQTPITNNSPYTIGGNLTIAAGSGNNVINPYNNDSVTAADFPVISGDLNIRVGNGDNSLLTVVGEMFVDGNLNATAGNGNNNAVDVFTDGNQTWTMGNGNNTFNQTTPPGGTLTWRSGNGIDNVALGFGPTDSLFAPPGVFVSSGLSITDYIFFGNNDDTLTLQIGSGNTLSGSVDGGGRVTGNTFNQISGILSPTFQLTNFP